MLKLSNFKTTIDEELSKELISKRTGIKLTDIISYKILMRSVDARKKPDIFYSYTLLIKLCNEEKYLNFKNIEEYKEEKYTFPDTKPNLKHRPLIVGMGPAGLFCGLLLARAGVRPIIIERGSEVCKRIEAVNAFWQKGELSPITNVQFGEGGAGTFSDGKLTTNVRDIRMSFIKKELVLHGAPEEILYLKKPHIGTDKLIETVKNIRNEIISLGGEVLFETKLTDIITENNRVIKAATERDAKTHIIECDNIILAIGHSARDTVRMLYKKNVAMEKKTFSIGGRIEHLQEDISKSSYGEPYKKLDPAEYKLAVKTKDNRGVYTFCMCPGGFVVASSSEKNKVVTNGMSYFKRDNKNANSAVLVTIEPSDLKSDNILEGIELQEKIEEKAFIEAGKDYHAPAVLVGDFLAGKVSEKLGRVIPTYKPGIRFCDIEKILPSFIVKAIKEAIPLMDKKLKGFASDDAILTFPETRSSSPVRIIRDSKTLQSQISGLYPCGEGAGYAGGIMSAACDGIKCAEQIIIQNSKI